MTSFARSGLFSFGAGGNTDGSKHLMGDTSPTLGDSTTSAEYKSQQSAISSQLTASKDATENLVALNEENRALILADREAAIAKNEELYTEIKSGYVENRLDSDALLGEMRSALTTEVGRIANAYNTQIAREAEKIDVMVAGGALGGNAYRAYQANAQSNRDLLAQATGSISGMVLEATDSLTQKGIDIAMANQGFYDSTMKLLAGVAGDQITSMLGFSELLLASEANLTTSLTNMYDIQLRTLAQANDLYISARKLDLDKYSTDVQSYTSLTNTRVSGSYSYASAGLSANATITSAKIRAEGALALESQRYDYEKAANTTISTKQPQPAKRAQPARV